MASLAWNIAKSRSLVVLTPCHLLQLHIVLEFQAQSRVPSPKVFSPQMLRILSLRVAQTFQMQSLLRRFHLQSQRLKVARTHCHLNLLPCFGVRIALSLAVLKHYSTGISILTSGPIHAISQVAVVPWPHSETSTGIKTSMEECGGTFADSPHVTTASMVLKAGSRDAWTMRKDTLRLTKLDTRML